MTFGEEDAARRYYLDAMKHWEAVQNDADGRRRHDGWMKTIAMFEHIPRELERSGVLAERGLGYGLGARAQFDAGLAATINGRLVCFRTPKSAITIGAVDLNDLTMLPGSVVPPSFSRLHAVCLRYGRSVVLLDLGSLEGVELLSSGGRAVLQRSRPKERRLLLFGVDEPVVLRLGSQVRVEFNA